jgi:lipid II:glycine glycyltransferase (peptidoglycan interpeptide bridge formation enzyme)
MVIITRRLFLRKAQVFLDDEYFLKALQSKSFDMVIALSYKNFGPMTGVSVREKTTALIDLLPDSLEIFKKFHDTTRNEINKTYKNDLLTIYREDVNKLPAYKMYSIFERSQGRRPLPMSEFCRFKLFSAYYKDEIISAITIIESGDRLRIRSIFSKRLAVMDKEVMKIISNASRRLMWEICQWGKDAGYQSLDLASVNFVNPRTASITKFKMSFGGQVINEYTYSYQSLIFCYLSRLISIFRKS